MPDPAASVDHETHAAEDSAAPGLHYDAQLRQMSGWGRLRLTTKAAAIAALVRAIGPTLRYQVLGWQHPQSIYDAGGRVIYPLWHRCMLSAMWWWRNREIVVLHSANVDGQLAGRVIGHFGYGTAVGSTSRGGLKGLVTMAEALGAGRDVAFTIDGPRGPRYVAKPGPVMLARRTGCPIVVFHIALGSAWTVEKSWDKFQVPRPFSRAVMVLAPPIHVPKDADVKLTEQKHAEMQAALDRVRETAESWLGMSPPERDALAREWNSQLSGTAR